MSMHMCSVNLFFLINMKCYLMQVNFDDFLSHFLDSYDYEGCDSAPANKMMDGLEALIAEKDIVGRKFSAGGKTYTMAKADNFSYTDPIDSSVSTKQVRQRQCW